jgi:excisionase family DNA binding protein
MRGGCMEEILNVREAAKMVRVTPVTFYRGLKNGKIPIGTKVNGQWRILKGDLESWLKWGRK